MECWVAEWSQGAGRGSCWSRHAMCAGAVLRALRGQSWPEGCGQPGGACRAVLPDTQGLPTTSVQAGEEGSVTEAAGGPARPLRGLVVAAVAASLVVAVVTGC